MDIRELQDSLKGQFDLTNVVDCQSVISMLLNDIDRMDARLLGLAKMVRDGSPDDVKDRVDKILDRRKQSPGKVMDFILRMGAETKKASQMTDKEIVDSIMDSTWGNMRMDSPEAATLEELIARFSKEKGLE